MSSQFFSEVIQFNLNIFYTIVAFNLIGQFSLKIYYSIIKYITQRLKKNRKVDLVF